MMSVVLSTPEAEYVAVSEVVEDIKFLYQMLRSIEIMVALPIKVQVDNVGAIWLANNSSVSERTKHVDIRAHFVGDMIKGQVIEINFVKPAKNDSHVMTKNQTGQHYMYAKSKLVYTVQQMNEKKANEDIEDKETERMLRPRFSYVFPHLRMVARSEASGPIRRSPSEEQTGTLTNLEGA